MNVKVKIATKEAETLTSVPSTTTVLTQQEIVNLGVDNAYDVLNFIPGFQITRGDWVGAVPKEHARGIYLDNGYILIMLNGQRLNESSFGKASVYTPFIPVDIIERVEIIRGPGSALYGSNAFLGVLNIITHKNKQQITLGIGDKNTQKLTASWSKKITPDLRINGNLNVQKSDGESYTSPLNRQVSDPYSNKYLEVEAHYRQSELYFHYNQNTLDQFINLGGYSKENQHQSETMNISLKSTLWAQEGHKLWGEFSFSNFEIASTGMVLPKDVGITEHDFLVGPFWKTQSSHAKFEHSWLISDKFTIHSGLELRHDSQVQAGVFTNHFDTNNELVIPHDDFYLGKLKKLKNVPEFNDLRKNYDIFAGYSQLKWQYKQNLSIFLGARYDDVENIDSQLSLRAATVWQANQHHTLKLQYGESFRPPVNNELYSNDEVTRGNPNLTSEFVKTTEVVWRYQKNKLASEVVYFHNDLRDFINKVPNEGNGALFTFANVIDKKIEGLETTINYAPSKRFKLTANYTQLFNEPINKSYKKFGSLSATYHQEHWNLSLSSVWRDTVKVPQVFIHDFRQSSYFLTNVSISYKIDKKQQLKVKATNVFDKHYNVFEPRMVDGKVPGQGRRLYLEYHYQF